MSLKYTGERLIIHNQSQYGITYLRHMAAYLFTEKFVQNKTVLDNGTGSGYGAYYLAAHGAKKVMGIDISPEAVDFASKKYKCQNLEYKIMDSTNLNINFETFDVVISFQVIEHLKNPEKFLKEIKRILKDSGIAVISTPNKETYSPNSSEPENPFHIKEYYLDEFRDLAESVFERVEIFGVSQSPQMEKLQKSFSFSFRKQCRSFLNKLRLSFLIDAVPHKLASSMSKYLNKGIGPSAFKVTQIDLRHCLDFIAVCAKK
jgi:SAM-dependent methyltransferase